MDGSIRVDTRLIEEIGVILMRARGELGGIHIPNAGDAAEHELTSEPPRVAAASLIHSRLDATLSSYRNVIGIYERELKLLTKRLENVAAQLEQNERSLAMTSNAICGSAFDIDPETGMLPLNGREHGHPELLWGFSLRDAESGPRREQTPKRNEA